MSLLQYESRFSALNPNRSKGVPSPHKVAMMLAVIDLIEQGILPENRIVFDSILIDAFTVRFDQLKTDADRNNPHLPFFHLQSEGFWHIKAIPGKSESWQKLATASSTGVIREHVLYAYLDDELFELLRNHVVRELLKTALIKNLLITETIRRSSLQVDGWDWLECEACVANYFNMLALELHDVKYNEAEHRQLLAQILNNRSEESIGFKHQNISAILIEMGFPYVSGYKPRYNYQTQLREVVIAHLAAHQDDLSILMPIQLNRTTSYESNWDAVLDEELPERIPAIARPERRFLGKIANYTQQESNNRQLGESGERFVLEFEQYRLKKAGRPDLAREVEWSSKDRGDGLGYDVRSFSINAEADNFSELFIEVKTTNSGKYQPFYVTENELAFSQKAVNNYSLFRVYDFRKRPRLFQLPGAIDGHVNLQPELFRATFTNNSG